MPLVKFAHRKSGRARNSATMSSLFRLVRALSPIDESACNPKLKSLRQANPMAWKVSPFENVEVARAGFLSEKDQRAFVKARGREGLSDACSGWSLHRCQVWRIGPVDHLRFQRLCGHSFHRNRGTYTWDPETVRFFQEVCAKRDLGETMVLRESGEPWVKDSQKEPMLRACTVAQKNPDPTAIARMFTEPLLPSVYRDFAGFSSIIRITTSGVLP